MANVREPLFGLPLPKPFYHEDGLTLYRADCRDILPGLGDLSADAFITDPPYEEEAHTKQRRIYQPQAGRADPSQKVQYQPVGFEAMDEPLRNFLVHETIRIGTGWAIVFCQAEAVKVYRDLYGPHYRRPMIWVKPEGQPQLTGDRPGMGVERMIAAWSGDPEEAGWQDIIASWLSTGRSSWNGGGKLGVFTYNKAAPRNKKNFHPTQKPETLMRDLVRLFTNPGDLVIDPFSGGGTTLKVCRDMGRRCIAIEKDTHNKGFCEYTVERLRSQPLNLHQFEAPAGRQQAFALAIGPEEEES